MKKINKTTFVVGTSIVAGLGSAQAIANNNPFELSELSSGYMNMAEAATEQNDTTKMKDGSCGEGKCGGKKDTAESKPKEGKCGEGKCGEGKCGEKKGAAEEKSKEGKCGEGKCGGKK